MPKQSPGIPYRMFMHRPIALLRSLLLAVLLLAGCDAFFGAKTDDTTDEIFREGRIDPSLLDEVGYVPLNPFFTLGQNGPLENPRDVYVGFDAFIYVVDDAGLHVLDLAGRPAALLPLDRPSSVAQDRRLHVYVTARRDTMLNGQNWNLPVVYRFSGLSGGTPQIEHIIWHPFDDDSRKFNRRDPIATDEQVDFTGVAVLHDNRVYISRRGPVNQVNSPILPHNAIMEFSADGINTRTISALNPNNQSLRSAINPTSVMTYFQPPQRVGFSKNDDFILTQSPAPGTNLRFAVLGIQAVETPDGIIFRPDTDLIRSAGNPEAGDGFLYEEFKFNAPSDLTFAGDGSNYIMVVDAGSDSLFVFTAAGIEGVAPPPGSGQSIPVVVSFGGTGDGPLQFNNPQGVAYFDRIVYVADTGNNRIARYKLNTDFE